MTLSLLLHYMHPSLTWEECTNSGGWKRFYREADLSYEHEISEGEKRLNNSKDNSPSNIEKKIIVSKIVLYVLQPRICRKILKQLMEMNFHILDLKQKSMS